MITFYYNNAPNPMKVALFLEETGLDYEPVPVDTRRGEQHTAEFLAINPNRKVPVIVDGETTVFDSNAILLYLAEKTGRFLPPEGPGKRGELLSWLMFVASGVGPYSGQAVHFRNNAPEKLPYALRRYLCRGRRYVSVNPLPRSQQGIAPRSRNIFRNAHMALRKAMRPLSSFHGRCGPASAASQRASALAFISRSISA
ncbi:MAG: glutathione S-transferase [Alphaproteobacteria bacterium]|nr:glutathione S-transferase [Alphaproteobacteria bacterium]